MAGDKVYLGELMNTLNANMVEMTNKMQSMVNELVAMGKASGQTVDVLNVIKSDNVKSEFAVSPANFTFKSSTLQTINLVSNLVSNSAGFIRVKIPGLKIGSKTPGNGNGYAGLAVSGITLFVTSGTNTVTKSATMSGYSSAGVGQYGVVNFSSNDVNYYRMGTGGHSYSGFDSAYIDVAVADGDAISIGFMFTPGTSVGSGIANDGGYILADDDVNKIQICYDLYNPIIDGGIIDNN